MSGATDWLHALAACAARGEDAVLVTVSAGRGSTPREPGTKMVVTGHAVHGTIGGGELEFQATRSAREFLREALLAHADRYPLGADLGQYCGGAADLTFERVRPDAAWVRVLRDWHDAGTGCVIATTLDESASGAVAHRLLVRSADTWGTLGDPAADARSTTAARALLDDANAGACIEALEDGRKVLLDPLRPSDFRVMLFGAGHVGRALVRALGVLACEVRWIDGRREEFPAEAPANVQVVLTEDPLREIAAALPGTYFLTMTHSHALDFTISRAILERDDFAFCGMIGSATKRRTFLNGLAKKGVPEAALARFTCPIGIEGIKAKAPGAIAIAVAAQLQAEYERRKQTHADPVAAPA